MTTNLNELPPSTRKILSILLFGVLILLSFGRSVLNDFTYDDFPTLVNNPYVQTFSSPWQILVNPKTHAGEETRVYRPLRTLLFCVQFALFGKNPLPYHLMNLTLHLIFVVLVWAFVQRFLPEPHALLVAVVCACHPFQTEVVASVKAQDDLLAGIMLMGGLLTYYHSVSVKKRVKSPALFLVITLYLLAMMAKENGVILPMLILGIWWVEQGHRSLKERIETLPWKFLSVLFALGLVYLYLRMLLMKPLLDSRLHEGGAVWLFPSALTFIPLYWRKFLIPDVFTIDYSALPIIGIDSIWFWISLCVQLTVVALLMRCGKRAVRLGVIWFYITILPSLQILQSTLIFSERAAYLPIVGMSILLVAGADWLARKILPSKPMAPLLLILIPIIAFFVVRSHLRTLDWRDNETLFKAAYQVEPDSVILRNFLVNELLRKGKTQEAVLLLGESPAKGIGIPQSFRERATYANLAVAALQKDEYAQAAFIYSKIVSSRYAKANDWLNYGTALTNLKRYQDAGNAFNRVLELEAKNAAARRMLGRIALEQSNFSDAVYQFDLACELDPSNAGGWYFDIFSTWKSRGEQEAKRKLKNARDQGVQLDEWFARDAERWKGASEEMKEALQLK
jgi:tetratricopeptide (TPR) repeat protein